MLPTMNPKQKKGILIYIFFTLNQACVNPASSHAKLLTKLLKD